MKTFFSLKRDKAANHVASGVVVHQTCAAYNGTARHKVCKHFVRNAFGRQISLEDAVGVDVAAWAKRRG